MSTAAIILNRQGIICAVEYQGDDFDFGHGWPQEDVVGQPFVFIHQGHPGAVNDISEGVLHVCDGKLDEFRYRFGIDGDEEVESCEYELVAGHDTPDNERIVVTYNSVDAAPTVGDTQELIAHTNIHEALFEHVPMGIVYQNNHGEIELVNAAAATLLGITERQLRAISPESAPWECLDETEAVLSIDEVPSFVTLATGQPQTDRVLGIRRRADGEIKWIKLNSECVQDKATGERTGVLTSFVDITDERKAQKELKAQTERTQMAVESAEIGIWDWLAGENAMIWDRKQFQLYGYLNTTTVSSVDAWRKALHPDDVDRVMKEAKDMMHAKKNKTIDYRVVWPNGSIRHLRSQARLVLDGNGEVVRIIGVTRDITNEVMAEKKLWELAYTDTLTGAYSRAGLNFRLSRSVARALKRDGNFTVVTFGLNRFKEINDNHGLSVGDNILCEVSRRAQSLICNDDTVARIGGDEFTMVLENVQDIEAVEKFIILLQEQVFKPVYLNGGLVVNLEASVGAAIFPDDGGDAATLLTNAGLATQHNREDEDHSYTRYVPKMTESVSRKFNLKYQLFSAVKDQEFQLYYQPIIDLHCNKVIGCEALIRWKDNKGNFVSPMEFIPVVEESGLICELGKWINLTAIRQWKMWQQLVPELKYISVNVSPRQIDQPGFVEELMALVNEHEIQPHNLQLEITEGTFLKESENSDGVLAQLANHGFRLAIDDFGTGYSSLAYLKRFNVDVIKIDRSFIKDIETDTSDRDIVSAILAMNKKLGFKTLVEGVETDKQDEIVHELGCDSAQGYLYGRPTFADDFAETYIRRHTQH